MGRSLLQMSLDDSTASNSSRLSSVLGAATRISDAPTDDLMAVWEKYRTGVRSVHRPGPSAGGPASTLEAEIMRRAAAAAPDDDSFYSAAGDNELDPDVIASSFTDYLSRPSSGRTPVRRPLDDSRAPFHHAPADRSDARTSVTFGSRTGTDMSYAQRSRAGDDADAGPAFDLPATRPPHLYDFLKTPLFNAPATFDGPGMFEVPPSSSESLAGVRVLHQDEGPPLVLGDDLTSLESFEHAASRRADEALLGAMHSGRIRAHKSQRAQLDRSSIDRLYPIDSVIKLRDLVMDMRPDEFHALPREYTAELLALSGAIMRQAKQQPR